MTAFTLSLGDGAFTLTGAGMNFVTPVNVVTLALGDGRFVLTGQSMTFTYKDYGPLVVASFPSDKPYVTMLSSVNPVESG